MLSTFALVNQSSFLKSSFSLFAFASLLDNSFSILLDSSTSLDNIITLNRTKISNAVKNNPRMFLIHSRNLLRGCNISYRASVISLCFDFIGNWSQLSSPSVFIAQGSWTISLNNDTISLATYCSVLTWPMCLRHIFLESWFFGGCGLHWEVSFQRNLLHFLEFFCSDIIMQSVLCLPTVKTFQNEGEEINRHYVTYVHCQLVHSICFFYSDTSSKESC